MIHLIHTIFVKPFSKFISSIILCELVGFLAVPFTFSAIPTWYATLTKPSFSPPSWVFGPVWTILYFLMGSSLFVLWNRGIKTRDEQMAIFYFFVQLGLNFLWSVLFFGLHSPILGLIDILGLLLFIAFTIKQFAQFSKTAAILLLPYLLWVCFATILNAAIVAFN